MTRACSQMTLSICTLASRFSQKHGIQSRRFLLAMSTLDILLTLQDQAANDEQLHTGLRIFNVIAEMACNDRARYCRCCGC